MAKDDLATATKEELELISLRTEIQHKRVELQSAELGLRTRLATRTARGKFHLVGNVDTHTATGLADAIDLYSELTPGGDIEIHIHSPGGYVFSGFAIYDHLIHTQNQGHYVTTVAHGYAASMAGIILQAGQTRIMTPDAYMMIHEISTGAIGKLSELTDEAKLSARLQERLFDKLAERSTLTARQIRNRVARKDWWLDADEALGYGFVDEIAVG